METIYTIIKSIVIFVLLSSVLEQLISGSSMQKYIRFFSGILLCILLLQGIFSFLNSEDFQQELERLAEEYQDPKMEEIFLEKENQWKEQEKNKKEEKKEQEKIEIPKVTIP